MVKPGLTRAQIVVVALGVLTAVLAIDQIVGLGPLAPGVLRAALLPADMRLCDRDWKRSIIEDVHSLDAIRQRSGVEPAVVDPRPFAPCPKGPCRNVDIGACDTVIYVRVAHDGYVSYALQGGP